MKIIDLTHTMDTGMPVYPGTEPPVFTEANTVARDGFKETLMTMYSHTGTHVDCPAHILADGATTSDLTAEAFFGPGAVVDCTVIAPGGGITRELLLKHRERIAAAEFILLRTGWSRYWGSEEYFQGYPVLEEDAVEYLLGFPIKGIGIDAISLDVTGPMELPVHRACFTRGIVFIENLTGLDALPPDGFLFSCLPLKLRDGDGSPVRAAAIIP
ncbi:MAG: cyclase family protein [Spirochaetes bacterium]|nr:cyclase family protein [Spirochaetota bacterium]